MVLESTMICVDNSDYMRNGDFVPTRLQAQQNAVNIVCHAKTRSNPENNVGLLTMSKMPVRNIFRHEVLVTLTTDSGRLLAKLQGVTPEGNIGFISGIRVAQLALKHRQGKNHRMRIVVFVGSPIAEDEKDLVKLAKRLKKEKVNVDIVNFGEDAVNNDKLNAFLNTINGKEGTSSHLVTVPSGPALSDALVSSPIVVGEDGSGAGAGTMAGFEYGVDANEDPELALALRVSMEEQRMRQEAESRQVQEASAQEALPAITEDASEEAMLKRALEMSMQPSDEDKEPAAQPQAAAAPPARDVTMMSEEEQIAYAMQMSMGAADEAMETDDAEAAAEKPEDEDDYSEVMNDPAFLQSVLQGLPGVDPDSEAIRNAITTLTEKDEEEGQKKDEKKK